MLADGLKGGLKRLSPVFEWADGHIVPKGAVIRACHRGIEPVTVLLPIQRLQPRIVALKRRVAWRLTAGPTL